MAMHTCWRVFGALDLYGVWQCEIISSSLLYTSCFKEFLVQSSLALDMGLNAPTISALCRPIKFTSPSGVTSGFLGVQVILSLKMLYAQGHTVSSPDLPKAPPLISLARGIAPGRRAEWLLFNDFCITPTNAAEVTQLYGLQKIPCLLYYKQACLLSPPTIAPAKNIHPSARTQLTSKPFLLSTRSWTSWDNSAATVACVPSASLAPFPRVNGVLDGAELRVKGPIKNYYRIHVPYLGPNFLML